MLKHIDSKYDNLIIYPEIPMFSPHPQVLYHNTLTKIQYPFSMKTSGLNLCIGPGNLTPGRTASSGTPGYSDSSSISVSKILDCTQQPFMVVTMELCSSVFPTMGPSGFSILSSKVEGKIPIRSALITSGNLNHEPS